MGYQDAFGDIVKTAVAKHSEVRRLWADREKSDQWAPAQKLCNHGQGPFDNDASVLCYCMLYMHHHYEAIRRPMKQVVQSLDSQSRVSMLDIGCGPMTAALALADRNIFKLGRVLKLNYVGVDISDPMIALARKFSMRADCFSENHYIRFVKSVGEISDRRLTKWAENATHMVIALSYVLSQKESHGSASRRICSTCLPNSKGCK